MHAESIHQAGHLGLDRDPHARNLMNHTARDVFTIQDDVALSRHQLTAETFEEGGFSRPIGANQATQLIAPEFHRCAVHRRHATKAHHDTMGFQHRVVLHGWAPAASRWRRSFQRASAFSIDGSSPLGRNSTTATSSSPMTTPLSIHC